MVWSRMEGAGVGRRISESSWLSDSEAEKKCRRGSSTSSRVFSSIDRKGSTELDTHAKDDGGQVGDGFIKSNIARTQR
jgi:hypothetical protein